MVLDDRHTCLLAGPLLAAAVYLDSSLTGGLTVVSSIKCARISRNFTYWFFQGVHSYQLCQLATVRNISLPLPLTWVYSSELYLNINYCMYVTLDRYFLCSINNSATKKLITSRRGTNSGKK